ncbi:MAG: HlyD family type I secretion periplasmic adaptor subunit [Alphaproteobacteria bacterium]|nr:HlyD family type I secretion periplasmic adaptor subunit [Alphaproteobacteria bacterium]
MYVSSPDPLRLFKPPADADRDLVATQSRLLDAQWRHYRTRVAAADKEVARARANRDGAAARIAKLDAVNPLLRERLDARATLLEKQLVPKSAYLELKQMAVENVEEARVMRQALAQAEEELSLAEEKRRQVEVEYARDLLAELGAKERDASAAQQDLKKAEQREARQVLLAPADGVVQDLAVYTVGGVVKPADVLMKIVPEDRTLEIEARVLNRDIGFVVAGQTVEIKIETFPYTKYGTVPGRVIDVSPDVSGDDPKNPAYRARIAMARQHIAVEGRPVSLNPGMTVTADILTGSRRAIEYVLAPVLRAKQEAMRER